MDDKKSIRNFYYKNLLRQDCCERSSSYPDGNNRYILKGIASINIPLLDVYYFYFPSIYKRNQGQKSRNFSLEKQEYSGSKYSLSRFFQYYLTYLMFQSLYCLDNKRTHHIRQLLDCILPQQNYQNLRLKIDQVLQAAYDQYASDENRYQKMAFKNAQKLKLMIRNNRSKLITELMEKQNWKKEHYPEKIIDLQNVKQIESFLNRVCGRIENIMVVLQSKKKELLKRMSADLKNNIEITIPLLTKKEKEKKAAQDSKYSMSVMMENKEIKKQNEDNIIILAKITNAVEPILTDMMDYLTFRTVMKGKDETNEQKKKRANIISKKQLVEDFLKHASRYYMNSKVTYPYLSIKDVLFDQKGLKVHFKHTSLIYEGLALHKNTNSIQLDLSTCPTPSALDFQACYKEKEEKFLWQLQKKYFFPEKYVAELQENQNGEPKELQESYQQISENVYIWRICCIIYYMQHRKNMMRESYNQYFSKKFNNPNPPFYTDLYQKHLKEVYQQIQTKVSYLRKLIQNENEENINQDAQDSGFNFTMNSLMSFYRIDSLQDSMIARCNNSMITSEFRCRILLSKDILSMMNNEKIFRRIINAKKYIIMFVVSTIEHLYQVFTLIYHELRKRGSRRKMLNSLREYRETNFISEEEKRIAYIKSTLHKLQEYLKRQMKDAQAKFLKENASLTKKVQSIGETAKEILILDKELNTYQHSMANQHSDTKDRAYLKTIMTILNKGEQSLIEAYKLLRQFVIEHIESKKAADLNKFEFSKNQTDLLKNQGEIENALKERLLQPIKAFLKMRSKNIYLYNSSVLPRLSGPSKESFKDIQKIKISYAQQIQKNLSVIKTVLEKEQIIDDIKYIRPKWWKHQYQLSIDKSTEQNSKGINKNQEVNIAKDNKQPVSTAAGQSKEVG